MVKSMSSRFRSIGLCCLIGFLFGGVGYVAILWGNYVSLGTSPAHEISVIKSAFDDESLSSTDYLDGNTTIGIHQYNDCIILFQAILRDGTRDQLSVSPESPIQDPPDGMCSSLSGYVYGTQKEPPARFYHEYIHGHTILTRILLSKISVLEIRKLYNIILTLLISMGISLSLFIIIRLPDLPSGLFWLIVFMSFGRWYGLETFGFSLGHAPADVVILSFLVFLAASKALGGLEFFPLFCAAALFGTLTITFEFLTGGLPLGLSILIGAVPFAVKTDRLRSTSSMIFGALVSFCSAVFASIIAKVIAVCIVFGGSALEYSRNELALRLAIKPGNGEKIGVYDFAKAIWDGLVGISPGMKYLAALMLTLAVFLGVWGSISITRYSEGDIRERAIFLSASAFIPPLSLLLFWEHTVIHAWFMDRMLVWILICGFSLFAMAVVERRSSVVADARGFF